MKNTWVFLFFLGHLNNSDFNYILDNIHAKLGNWKTNFHSPAGRVVLIQSTLNTKPNYAMQIFELPNFTLKAIDKAQRVSFGG